MSGRLACQVPSSISAFILGKKQQ